MSDFFYAIQGLFEDVLFIPLDALRFLDSWWLSNAINCVFIIIGFIAFGYWMMQMRIFSGQEKDTYKPLQ